MEGRVTGEGGGRGTTTTKKPIPKGSHLPEPTPSSSPLPQPLVCFGLRVPPLGFHTDSPRVSLSRP